MSVNRGTMTTQTHSSFAIREIDPKMYRNMDERREAALVSLLRLATMKRYARAVGKRGFAFGSKLKNVKQTKFEWANFDLEAQKTFVASVANDTSTSAQITVEANDGAIFTVNDIILNRNTGERMIVQNVNGDVITVARGTAIGMDGNVVDDITAGDYLLLIANAFAEGTRSPEARSYNPQTEFNYVQIFKRTIENTNTNEAVEDYFDINKLSEQKKEEWFQYLIEREKAYFMGLRSEKPDPLEGGKMRRTTAGLDYFIRTNVIKVPSLTWGVFDEFTKRCYRKSKREKIMICNSNMLSEIEKLVRKEKIVTTISPKTKEFGFNIQRLTGVHGSFDYVEDMTMNDIFEFPTGYLLDPALIGERVLRADHWTQNIQANDLDGRKDEIKGECGLQVKCEDRHGKLVLDPSAPTPSYA